MGSRRQDPSGSEESRPWRGPARRAYNAGASGRSSGTSQHDARSSGRSGGSSQRSAARPPRSSDQSRRSSAPLDAGLGERRSREVREKTAASRVRSQAGEQGSSARRRRTSSTNPPTTQSKIKAAFTDDGRVVGSNRDLKIFIVFCLAALALVIQLVNLQIIQAADLSAEARAQRVLESVIPAKRGDIYDRNLNLLATSVEATTIYVDPTEVVDANKTAAVLVEILGGSAEEYYPKLTEAGTFVYIMQKADTALAQRLKDKQAELQKAAYEQAYANNRNIDAENPPKSDLYGIHFLSDMRRDYPYGDIGMQVIGMVDSEGNGMIGIEQMYDSVLRGTDGKSSAEYSRSSVGRPLSGTPIPGSDREDVPAINGTDIVISIDIEAQRYAETRLAAVGAERQTNNGNVLLLDGANGEIIAAASLPLAKRFGMTQEEVDNGAISLKAISFSYEPGSTFKPLTAAAVLEEKAMPLEEVLYVPFSRDYTEYSISDAHEHTSDMMDFTTILAQSSNVGISMVKDRISNEVYAEYLAKFGIDQATHVDYPGEATGSLADVKDWTDVQTANISFGQGVAVSSLQIASFYGAVANGGTLHQAHFLLERRVSGQASGEANEFLEAPKEILSAETCVTLTDMLETVVSEGTGSSAAIEGYKMAGKTGTAEKASPDGGYLPDEYIVSFVGYFADTNSKLTCITSMDNPDGAEGNAPTGPLFADIMKFAGNRYMIVPNS